MATVGDVVEQMRASLHKAEECATALSIAATSAADAAEALRFAVAGSGDDDALIAVASWDSVTSGIADALALLNRAQASIREVLQRLNPDPTPRQHSTDVTTGPDPDQRRARLPTYITSGHHDGPDGRTVLVQSGREPDGEHDHIAEYLRAAGIVRKGTPTVAMHVETKVAWRMRTGGQERVELVINNPICDGPMSCRRVLPTILLDGQELTVHDPTGTHVFRGRSSR